MRKMGLLSLFVIMALLLAACGGAEGNQGTNQGGTLEPGLGVTEGASGLGVTPDAGGAGTAGTPGALGEDTQPTAAVGGGAAGGTVESTRMPTATSASGAGAAGGATGTVPATRMPTATSAAGGAAGGATGQPTTAGTQTGGLVSTPVIPVTGLGSFARGSELLDYRVELSGAAGDMGGSGGGLQTGTPSLDATPDMDVTPDTSDSAGASQTGTPAAGATSDAGGLGGTTAAGQVGEEVGTVEDVILPVMGDSSMAGQQMAWLVVSVDESFLGLGPNQLIPVPLRGASIDSDRQVIMLDVDRSMLEQAPSFTSSQWPDLSVAGWDTGFTSFWMNENDAGGAGGAGQATAMPTTPAGGAGQATAMPTTSVGGAGASQTGTPAAGATSDAGGTGDSALQTATPSVGGTGGTTSVSFVRLSDLLGLSVQSSQVGADGAGGVDGTDASQTGTPASDAGDSAGGAASQTGTPAIDSTPAAGGSMEEGQGALLGDVEDVIIDFSGMSASDGTSGGVQATPQVGTPTVNGSTATGGSSTTGSSAGVLYLIVSADASLELDADANLVAIPWQQVESIQPDSQLVLVDVSLEQFQMAPGFGATEWPDMAAPGWNQSWDSYWMNDTNP